jgi:serine protease Do
VSRWQVTALIVACLAPVPPPAFGQHDLDVLEERAFQAAVARVAPSVVRIETIGGLEQVGRVLFGTGPATGLVVDSEGYVVTSALHFLNEPSSILVRLPDGTRTPAELVATDHSRMLVLLKIEVDRPLPVPDVVPEAEMRVGQWAIAVGRTFDGDGPNVSVGIVSALERVWGKAIQTDAAVSPNNYGGPLVDVRGRVLGVLVPLSPQAGSEVAGVEWYDSGIGFAVPAAHVERILPRLKRGEDLHGGVIGISFAPGNLSTTEPVIAARHPNSPASEAGLEAGDRIVEIEGRKIVRASQVKEELARRYAGQTVRMVILRDDRRIQRALELIARLEPYEHPFLGILPMRNEADRGPKGVTVRYVYPKSPAAAAGIQPGDVLTQLAGGPFDDADSLRRRIGEHEPDDDVALSLLREGRQIDVAVRLGRLPEDLPPDGLPPASAGPPEERPPAGDRTDRPQVGPIELKIPEFENDAWAYVPESYDPARRYGLIVFLHGAGDFDWSKLLARWKRHCDRHGLILLAPESAQPGRWQLGELTLVGKLLDEIRSAYALDPARIVVHGHAGGGRLGYLVAFANRDSVRAVAAVDAPVTGRPPENDPVYRLAFYLAWAAESAHAGPVEQAVDRLREMKYPVTVHRLGDPPRDLDPRELAELVRWIDALDRI